MMNKELDWEEMGKAMPYRVSPTFFADSEEKIMARIQAEAHPSKRSRLIRFVLPATAVAAVLAVVLSISIFRQADVTGDVVAPGIFASTSLQMELLNMDPDMPTEMDDAIENLSDADLAELVAQVNGDVFLF